VIAAALLLMPAWAAAQVPVTPDVAGADQVDPNAPMAPLPDLGVEWPDLATPEAAPTAATPDAAITVHADREQRYRVVLVGIEELDSTFRTRFDQLSALVTNESKPANTAQIDRRARDDEDLARTLLRAAGRYDATVSTEVTGGGDQPILVRFTIEPAKPYSFASIALPGLEAVGQPAESLRGDFTIHKGDAIDADKVIAAIAAFRADLGRRGYPFAKVGEPDITVDHQTATATLSLPVTPGNAARFGQITTSGPRPVFTSAHLADIARFHTGRPYDAGLIDDFRRALIQTGLVSAVTITPVPTADPGIVDIDVRIDRAPRRTIAGELGYGTGEGARIEASWQHRNLITPEGAVTFRGVLGTREQSLGSTLRMSNFRGRDKVLTAQAVAAHTNLNAYDARSLTLGASLERQTNIIWQKTWTWSLGTELLATDERDTIEATGQPRRRTFFVLAGPTSLAYDGSDDLLNPTRGHRLSARVSPEASLQNGTDFYVKMQIDGSGYVPIGGRVSLAGRFRFGVIEGAQRDSIAPSRRFYSGGGGSVRGYGYQDIGPKDVNGDPVGGRALTEFSAEARIRFGSFGVVPFVDAGNLYAASIPKFSGLRYGAGLGVRYYSSFGPIRVDVGTPINRRPGEARVAVYVSLGQAF
jgi:translocation and assembly module TamA